MTFHPRYHVLDWIRGFTLISMILYHALYDLHYLYRIPLPGYDGLPGYIWQQSICWTFIFLSGLCHNLGRNPVKRGLILSCCGLLVTLATAMFSPDVVVIMGILSFFGLATLLTALLDPVFDWVPARAGFAVSLLLFFLTRNISAGFLGFEGLRLLKLPRFLYQGVFMMILGFPYDGFYSTDYFSLFPWIFLFWSGLFTFRIRRKDIREETGAPQPVRPFFRPLEKIGQHTLPLYMLHQPVLMGLFSLLDLAGVL